MVASLKCPLLFGGRELRSHILSLCHRLWPLVVREMFYAWRVQGRTACLHCICGIITNGTFLLAKLSALK